MYGSDDRTTQLEDQISLVKAIELIRHEQSEIRKEQSESRREQAEFRVELKKNSELTAKNNTMTEEMFDLFAAAKGTFKFFGWIGKAITWTGGVAAALGALWLIFKGGFPPK
jgi:hypothetical protein